MSGFHWPGLMRLGLQDLRLDPDVFWALTPAELLVIAGLDGGGAPALTRAGLADLQRAYPDGANGGSEGR